MSNDQFVEEPGVRNRSLEGKNSMEKWMNSPEEVTDPNDNSSAGFDCNICLDSVQDPVVTLCGHIYCWPCIYKWLQFRSDSTENQDHKHQQCPVCKSEVSDSTLVPLYVLGRTSKASRGKSGQLDLVIPKRPLGPDFNSPRSPNTASTPQLAHQMHNHHNGYSYRPQPQPQPQLTYGYSSSPMLSPGGTTMDVPDPLTRMFSEMVYTRVFGDSITDLYTYPDSYNLVRSTSPRIRRHIMQADKSLNRLSFFLFCCLLICLILF